MGTPSLVICCMLKALHLLCVSSQADMAMSLACPWQAAVDRVLQDGSATRLGNPLLCAQGIVLRDLIVPVCAACSVPVGSLESAAPPCRLPRLVPAWTARHTLARLMPCRVHVCGCVGLEPCSWHGHAQEGCVGKHQRDDCGGRGLPGGCDCRRHHCGVVALASPSRQPMECAELCGRRGE